MTSVHSKDSGTDVSWCILTQYDFDQGQYNIIAIANLFLNSYHKIPDMILGWARLKDFVLGMDLATPMIWLRALCTGAVQVT